MRARLPEDVLYDIQPQPSQAQRQQRPARRPTTVTDATATTFMAERAAAEAQRTSSRHLPKPAPQAQGPPPTGPERRQGLPAASWPPYQPSVSAHIQRMPRYCRRRESQANPEAETVRAHPRVHIRSRPHSPRTPTAQDYEESPGLATATSPHDPVTPTHAHSSAQDRGPAQGQWWQRWTHTQLWELRKRVRAEPSLEGLVHRPRKGSVENCRLQPVGGWMPQAAWEAMLADVLHPLGVQPRNLLASQDHRYVLRRLRETLQETQRDGIRLWDITQSPTPRTHTPSPPHKRQRTDTGGTHKTPGALRATEHDTPDPPASRRRHLTLLPRKPRPRGATPGPAQKSRSKLEAEDANAHDNGHRYAQRHRTQARNRHNRLAESKPQYKSNPSHTPKPLTLDS